MHEPLTIDAPQVPDQQLLERYVRHASQEAFAELVKRYIDLIYSSALRQVRDPHLADDCTQAVFLLLAQKASTLRADALLVSWLYRALRYVCANALRQSAIRRRHEMKAAHAHEPCSAIDNEDFQELAARLDQAMASLNGKDRDVVLLRFFKGLSHREIATLLSTTEEAARKRVSRALEQLRRVVMPARSTTLAASAISAAIESTARAAPPTLVAASTSHPGSPAAMSLAKGALLMMNLSKAKIIGGAAAAVVLLLVGGGAMLRGAQHPQDAAPAPKQIAAALAPLPAAKEADVQGILLDPNGKPLANATVYMTTTQTQLDVYADQPLATFATTDAAGKFTFLADPENLAVVVPVEQGYGQATIAQLRANPKLQLQSWGRIEGTLRRGANVVDGKRIRLSRTRFGIRSEREAFHTVHDTAARTDEQGRFVFSRVVPGDTWLIWEIDEAGVHCTRFLYVDAKPGQTNTVNAGGAGRDVIGKVELASGGKGRFYGSLWIRPKAHMLQPPGWNLLGAKEREAIVDAWKQTAAGKSYNQEQCPIDFTVRADGSFIIPDVEPADYHLVLATWSGEPAAPGSKMTAVVREHFTIEEIPGGRSDTAFDVGLLKATEASATNR